MQPFKPAISILSLLLFTSSIQAAYRAAVPCYDTTLLSKYGTACKVTNSLGASWFTQSSPLVAFTCDGNVPGVYWETLQGLGLATCVCGFEASDKSGPWSYFTQYGTCNGACTAQYTCDGTTPVVGNAGGSDSSGSGNNGSGSSGSVVSSAAGSVAPPFNGGVGLMAVIIGAAVMAF